MVQFAQTRQDQTDWVVDPDGSELPSRSDFAEVTPAKTGPGIKGPSVAASLVPLDQGLYALEIAESRCPQARGSGLQFPFMQISAPLSGQDKSVEIIDVSGRGEPWLGHQGGTVVVKAPPGGGHVLVTAYGLPAQVVSVPEIEVRRLDRSRPKGGILRVADGAGESEEVRTEIVLHIERLGDRRFPGQGWVGDRGKKLRIEAFSIRPVNALLARDIEFKALGPKRRQTPWVTDAKLCGTRGQGLPLTGFAVRLAPHVGEHFDVVYEGAFFESGVIGPNRNGELCVPPIADDPLEAMNLRLIRRAAE
jgi:hypothetical protein